MSVVSAQEQSVVDEHLSEKGEQEEVIAEEAVNEIDLDEFEIIEEPYVSEQVSSSSSEKLKEDFCLEEGKAEEVQEEEEEEEEVVEEEWVCEEVERVPPYYGEGCLCAGEYGEEEEEDFLSPQGRKSLDSEYLKSVLGTPLTYALLDIATKRPTDPIQYLSFFLVRWKYGYISDEKRKTEIEELTREREAYQEKLREISRQSLLQKEEEEEKKRRRERIESSLEESDYGEEIPLME